jgi:hypothetical protein
MLGANLPDEARRRQRRTMAGRAVDRNRSPPVDELPPELRSLPAGSQAATECFDVRAHLLRLLQRKHRRFAHDLGTLAGAGIRPVSTWNSTDALPTPIRLDHGR